MICNIAWLCKSILYFEQHTAVILTLLLFSCFIVWLQDYPQRQKPLLPHKVVQKQAGRREGGGGGYIPCKWVLLVQHNFVDEAVAAITTGRTNVEEGEEMEVQWKILDKVHLYVQEGKLQEE